MLKWTSARESIMVLRATLPPNNRKTELMDYFSLISDPAGLKSSAEGHFRMGVCHSTFAGTTGCGFASGFGFCLG